VGLAILAALAYPPLGVKYLYPEITSDWVAVVCIFIISGLSLKTKEILKSMTQIKFHIFLQIFNLGFVPLFTYGLSRLLAHTEILTKDFADGLVVMACLPTTVNMVIVLTTSSGGDEACALLNAAMGNFIGVFVTPALITGYLGKTGHVHFMTIVLSLCYRVLIPTIFGQLLRTFVEPINQFVTKRKSLLSKLSEWALVYIVYTVFCKTFDASDLEYTASQILMVALFVIILMLFFMQVSWVMLKYMFKGKPELIIMGFFGCHHKTVAMGLPLLKAIYEEDPKMGMYALPLLIWHPLQLIVGTALAPKLKQWRDKEE